MIAFFLRMLFLVLYLLYAVGRLMAQDVFAPQPYGSKPRVQAQQVMHRLVIDGRLDEADWRRCQAASGFMICFPEQFKKPTYDTRVMVLYDSVNIYFGAICYFSGQRKSLQVQSMKRDFGYTDNELLSIFIEPFQNSRLPMPGFYVSPYGTQTDIAYYNSISYDYNWDAVWTARTYIGDSAWTAEIAIPFSSLRYPKDSSVWSINFDRNIRNKGEYTGWSPWPMAYDPSRIIYGGLLTDIHPPQPKVNLRLQPYALVKKEEGRNARPAIGGEIKWALQTNTVADITVNTDFAQADVDAQVVNLTRSSVFFPEKRQFFKENANLFAVGQDGMLQPFFSRRIGLSSDGRPFAIDGGLRLIHQTDKQAAGLLVMRQEGDSVTQPAWFNVLRYRRELGRWQLGGMAVLRYDQGDGRTGGQLNTVGALDAYIKLSEECYVRQMLSASADGGMAFKGLASVTEFNYTTNKILSELMVSVAGKEYHARSGFMERSDFIHTQPAFQLLLKPRWLPDRLSFFNPMFTADIYHQASDVSLQEINATLSPLGVLSRTGGEYRLNLLYSYERIGETFSPVRRVDIAPGRYSFLRWELYASTNQAAAYCLQARISTGRYYDIRLNSYNIVARVTPEPHMAFGVGFTENHFSGMGKGIETEHTYLIAPELRLAWNARLQLHGFYQYNTDEQTGSLNLRFSWEYRPLSFVYLVINSNNHLKGAGPSEEMAILKASYIRQL